MQSPQEPDSGQCTRCGAVLANEARGNCPACLLRRLLACDDPALMFPEPPGYTVLEEIGRGGAGVVWRARQRSLGREVALKVLTAGLLASETERWRLRREAEAMARLRHPHIAAVYEVGEVEGHVFLAMDLFAGGSLSDRLKQGPMESKSAAALIRQVADAMVHAHDRGVIHRDLKPANILLDHLGAPYLADFGLAKLLPTEGLPGGNSSAPSPELTLTGQTLGTVHYLAPEQAGASSSGVGPSADIHAIGAILYHCLTGRPPFLGESFAATLRQVTDELPMNPRVLNPAVSRDLENICLKCLRKNPHQRYLSAEALREDLDRYLSGKPVAARPVPAVVRLAALIRRFPVVTFLLAATAVSLILGGGAVWRYARVEKGLRLRTVEANRRLEFTLLDQAESKGQRDLTLQSLVRMARASPQDEVVARRLAWALQESPLALPDHEPIWISGTAGAHVSPNHRWLAAAEVHDRITLRDLSRPGYPIVAAQTVRGLVSRLRVSDDGLRVVGATGANLFLWNVGSTNPVLRPMTEPRTMVALEISPDSKVLATADDLGQIALWNLPALVPTGVGWLQSKDVRFLRFSPNSKFLTSSSEEDRMRVVEVATGKFQLTLHTGSQQHCWGQDGRSLLTCDHQNGSVEVWDVLNRKVLLGIGPLPAPTCAVYSPDHRRIATGTYGGTVQLWDASTGKSIGPAMEHSQWIRNLEFSPDGSLLATVCHDGSGRIWVVETGRLFCQPLIHPAPLRICAFAGDSHHVFTQTGAGWGQIWSFPPDRFGGIDLVAPGVPSSLVTGSLPFALSSDGRFVATAANDGKVQLARLNSLVPLPIQTISHPEGVHQVVFSPQGDLLATVATNGVVRFWNPDTLKLKSETTVADQGYFHGQFSPDGRIYVAGGILGAIDVISVETGECRRLDGAHSGRVRTIEFSPDGRRFVSGAEDFRVKLWSTASLKKEAVELLHSETPNRVIFSPRGDRLYTACSDNKVHRWAFPSGTEMLPPLANEGPIMSLSLSDDGRYLLNSCDDGNARLWDLDTVRIKRNFPMSGQMQSCLSPDGRLAATGNDEGTFRLWDVESGLAVTGIIRQQKGWIEPRFSRDGRSLIAGSRAIEAKEWAVPPVEGPLPEWLLGLAEAASGREFNQAGISVPSTPERRCRAVAAVRKLSGRAALDRWGLRLVGQDLPSTPDRIPR